MKKAHVGVIPGIKEFVAEYVSDKALGQEGYLADKGLIPPSERARQDPRGRDRPEECEALMSSTARQLRAAQLRTM